MLLSINIKHISQAKHANMNKQKQIILSARQTFVGCVVVSNFYNAQIIIISAAGREKTRLWYPSEK